MWEFLTRLFAKTKPTDIRKQSIRLDMPIRAGRSSVSPHEIYYNNMTALEPDFGITYLPIIQHLSVFHHDISKAVINVISLANTEDMVEFDASVSPRNATKMLNYLKEVEKTWVKNGTKNTLVNGLFRQLSVYGALSAERVINKNLSGIEQIVTVSPQRIRFIYENGLYLPHQETPILADTRLGLKQLNTTTYKYIPLQTEDETPYGIPPFISALYAVGIERDMLQNFANIAEKVGMFGFLEALITAPEQSEDESDEAYLDRVVKYRDSIAGEISKTVREGYVVGFEGSHNFKVSGNVNANGAEKMLEMVDTLKMAGLGQDPNLFGRHTTVTETFGRVLLAIMITQTQLYQEIVADFLADTRLLALKLAGFNVREVKVWFKSPLIGDELKEEQTIEKRISNLSQLYAQGIISQTQFANKLGYESPYLSEPLAQTQKGNDTDSPSNDNSDKGNGRDNPSAKSESEANEGARLSLYQAYPTFAYAIPFVYQDDLGRTDWQDPLTQTLADKYLDDTENLYAKQVTKVANRVGQEVSRLKAPTLAGLESTILTALIGNWADTFAKQISKVAKQHVNKIYKAFRSDTSIFPKQTASANSFKAFPPVVKLDLIDERVLEYMLEHDTVFLSKFITDPDTKKRITDFIREFHIENGEAIGDNDAIITEFKNRFSGVLNGEMWKIRRVLDTTVNKLRAYGNLNYMHQAGIKTFTIVEVMDRVTCRHCQHIDGKSFDLSLAREKMERVINARVEDIDSFSPFATSIPIDDFESMPEAELQAKGFDTPPFHPSCRGRVVVG